MSMPSSVRSTIEAADRLFEAAFGRGDAAGVAELYTATAQIFPPQSDAISGRQAIQGFWQAVMNAGVRTGQLVTVEVSSQGDSVYEVGQYTLKAANDQIVDRGKYVVIWQRDGGTWKLHRDIWNTSISASTQ